MCSTTPAQQSTAARTVGFDAKVRRRGALNQEGGLIMEGLHRWVQLVAPALYEALRWRRQWMMGAAQRCWHVLVGIGRAQQLQTNRNTTRTSPSA